MGRTHLSARSPPLVPPSSIPPTWGEAHMIVDLEFLSPGIQPILRVGQVPLIFPLRTLISQVWPAIMMLLSARSPPPAHLSSAPPTWEEAAMIPAGE